MPHKQIITGQEVKSKQLERAQDIRRKMTPAETPLWQRIRAGRLDGFHFRRQQVIGPFIADFYCHQVDLVVEVDGSAHQNQVEYDLARDRYLQERGLRVLRFTNQDVERNLEAVLPEILEACRAARDNLSP